MHRTEQYLNGQIWWLSIPNTPKWDQNLQFAPQNETTSIPIFFFIWESPTEDYLIFEEPVGYEGTKKWYRQHRARDTLGERGARGIVSVTAFQNLASQSHYILYPIDNYVLS